MKRLTEKTKYVLGEHWPEIISYVLSTAALAVSISILLMR